MKQEDHKALNMAVKRVVKEETAKPLDSCFLSDAREVVMQADLLLKELERVSSSIKQAVCAIK